MNIKLRQIKIRYVVFRITLSFFDVLDSVNLLLIFCKANLLIFQSMCNVLNNEISLSLKKSLTMFYEETALF